MTCSATRHEHQAASGNSIPLPIVVPAPSTPTRGGCDHEASVTTGMEWDNEKVEKNKASHQGRPCDCGSVFAEPSGELLALAETGIGLLGFVHADVAVAVDVERLELLGGAEELTRGNVAVG